MIEPLKTSFASAERSSQEDLLSLSEHLKTQEFLIQSFNAFPDVILVLDRNRQIVFANTQAADFFGVSSLSAIVGKRTGEAIGCVHAGGEMAAAGCGTTKFCRQCGAVRSILEAQGGCQSVEECSLFARGKDGKERAYNLRVWSVPFQVGKESVTLVILRNIALEKRLESLEKTFFHDILNSAGILKGYSENLRDGLVPRDEKAAQKILNFTQRIIDMIQMQRTLIAAEQGELFLDVRPFLVFPFLKDLCESIKEYAWGYEQRLVLDCPSADSQISTDRTLLERVLVNLIKNAFEASSSDQDTVVLKYERLSTGHLFSAHNDSLIPEDVQLQIFERAFSTKGYGRGIGTYSVKLFTEQYLGGKAFFRSDRETGTTFFVQIPIVSPSP